MIARDEYQKFSAKLIDLFDLDWDKYSGRIEAAYDFLKHIPPQAFEPMVKLAVDQWDSWPRNWSKAVKNIYEVWRSDAGRGGGLIQYDKIEDHRYPIELMQKALTIYEEQGNGKFVEFCDSTHMPENDRDRVRFKHEVRVNPVVREQLRLKIQDMRKKMGMKIMPFAKETPRKPKYFEDEVPF